MIKVHMVESVPNNLTQVRFPFMKDQRCSFKNCNLELSLSEMSSPFEGKHYFCVFHHPLGCQYCLKLVQPGEPYLKNPAPSLGG